MTPSHPQYSRKSRVQPRIFGAHTPGSLGPQPCPSQIPEAHSVAARHGPPSASAPSGASGPSEGGASVGVAVSVGGDDVGGGGAEPGFGAHATSVIAISNSRIRMGALYTPRRE